MQGAFLMKLNLIVPILSLVLFCVNGTVVLAQDDIKDHRSCSNCGMDRKAYGFSRMLVNYEDGTVVGTCSLHCAVIELDANPGKTVKSLLVADRDSRTMLDAEKAIWVMGGKKRGVMTERPKWAFQTKEDAEVFIRANGGKIVTWAEALVAAREDAARKSH
jgi:copper chaperone NosL